MLSGRSYKANSCHLKMRPYFQSFIIALSFGNAIFFVRNITKKNIILMRMKCYARVTKLVNQE